VTPLINIITRTSNRPNSFRRNLNSIRSQTYSNINHIICTDDKDSISYIENSGIKDFHFIDKEQILIDDITKKDKPGLFKSISGQKLSYAPYNLYFNEIHKYITDGWIIYLDDDDVFYGKDSVSKIVDVINKNDNDTMIIWKMIYSNLRELPEDISDRNPPKLNQIGGSCFTFHSKYLDLANWDSWKGSDFRVINKLYKSIPNTVWFPEKIVYVPSIGLGQKKDINNS